MKKSFMTRVLAVTMSAAMAFSLSSANMVTASAANSSAALNTTFKTLTVGKHFNYKLYLSKNTANWKISTVKTSNKSICTIGTKGKEAEAVYLKAKGEGSATITVKLKTSKRKTNNTKTLKCKVKVKPAQTTPDNPNNPSEEKLTVSAAASDASNVKVAFSQAIDKDSVTKDSFKFADTSVSVTNAVVSEDGKTVDLTISGAKESTVYKMTVTGVKVAGTVQADMDVEFSTPDSDVKLVLEAGKTVLNSNGADQTVVTCKVVDKNGNAITGKKMEIAFSATDGNFADKSVSVKEDGIAENMYTSEQLSVPKTAFITATVVESDDKDLYGKTTNMSILLTPNANEVDSSVGAIITSAEAGTADRVIAYFDKEVHAKDFQTENGYTDSSKFTAKVYSGLDNAFNIAGATTATTHEVVGFMDVEGVDNALQLLVDKPMTDNSNVLVEFADTRNKASVIQAKNAARFKLTDARQPSMLNVECTDYKTIKVTYSEAVLPKNYATTDAQKFAADVVANYRIDGYPLSNYNVVDGSYSSSINNDPTVSSDEPKILSTKDSTRDTLGSINGDIKIGTFNKGEDKRFEVTITLGEGKELSAGKHSLQASNVGDWAANSDLERNTINTQTFDFNVQVDENAPSFDVVVQSPEQYAVTFTSPVRVVDTTKTLKTPDSSSDKSVLELRRYDGKNWVEVSGDAWSLGNGKNPISVSKASGEGVPANQYIVEVQNDWTQVYNTEKTYKNYTNDRYALFIAKEAIYNTANGKKNPSDLLVELTLPRDNESPKIEDAVPATTRDGKETSSYYVTMNEPVKLSATANTIDTLTPSEKQSKGFTGTGNQGVPVPFARFEKQDGSKRVDAEINTSSFADAYDKTFLVKPSAELDAGTWDLIVGSISDDIDNTAETLVKPVTITKATVNTDFKVVWAAVSKTPNYSGISRDYGSYIFVKFNKPVSLTGGSANALNTSNYTLGGAKLPQGTDIFSDIEGYDNQDNVVDSITIRLPQASATQREYTVSGENAVLNISQSIKSLSNEALSNGQEKKLPFQYGVYGNFAGLTATGDALWGNDPSEMSKSDGGNINTGADYYQALVKALKDDQYREVKLSENIDLDDPACKTVRKLLIDRPVDIDLNGHTISGNVEISSTTAVDKIEIKSSIAGASITGSTTNQAEDYTLTVNTPWVRSFVIGNNVTIGKTGNTYSTNLNGIYKNTFHNFGILKGVAITAASEVGFDNAGIIDDGFQIKTSSTVNLSGNYDSSHLTGSNISVDGATINIVKDVAGTTPDLSGVTVDVVNKATTINVNTVPTGTPTIVANNVKVTVNGSTAALGAVTVQKEGKDAEAVTVNTETKEESKPDNVTEAQTVVNNIVNAISNSALTVTANQAADTTVGDGLAASIAEVVGADTNVEIALSVSDANLKIAKIDGKDELVVKSVYKGAETTRKITLTIKDNKSSASAQVTLSVTFAANN